jgi:heme-degrading monooxygenase HmoA
MFARVITAQAGEYGFDDLIRSATQELPDAQRRPGFAGYFLLTDDSTGNAIIISLWKTREDMTAVARGATAGIHDAALPETILSSMRLETYEVAVRA